MGALCGGPDKAKADTIRPADQKSTTDKGPVTSMKKEKKDEAWKKIELKDKMTIKIIHNCVLTKFTGG